MTEDAAPKQESHKTDKEPCKHVYDELAEPQNIEINREHPLCAPSLAALREIYDPEIPVNVYELGLIYGVYFEDDNDKNVTDIPRMPCGTGNAGLDPGGHPAA